MPQSGPDGSTWSEPSAAVVRAELGEQRQRAVARAGDLQRAFDALVEATEGSNVDDEHDPEGATIAFERSQLTAALERATIELAEVDGALDRLAAATYGRCEVCGEPIPAERLTARPTATRCVTCADAPASARPGRP
jgi:RNA polymerase-binding transcription factor DksA